MIREPLAGIASNVPVGPETRHPLSSPGRTVQGIIRCAEASDGDWGSLTAINLPGLSISVGDMAQALRSIAGDAAWSHLSWNRDPKIESIVAAWPRALASPRAASLGLQPNASFEEIVKEYIRENPDAVKREAT
jgi:nucleoside-diphosphate-sugar epimerase